MGGLLSHLLQCLFELHELLLKLKQSIKMLICIQPFARKKSILKTENNFGFQTTRFDEGTHKLNESVIRAKYIWR